MDWLIQKSVPGREDEPRALSGMKPMRAFAGFPIGINLGRLVGSAPAGLRQIVWQAEEQETEALSGEPTLDIELVQAAREAFAPSGEGRKGSVAPGHTLILAALGWAGGKEAVRAVLERGISYPFDSDVPVPHPSEAIHHSLKKRELKPDSAGKEMARAVLFSVYPQFQIYRNIDYYMGAMLNLVGAMGGKIGAVLGNTVSAGAMPLMRISVPSIQEAQESYLQTWKRARSKSLLGGTPREDEPEENLSLARQHPVLTYQASALVGAANILSSFFIEQMNLQFGRVRGVADWIGANLGQAGGPAVERVEVYGYFQNEQGQIAAKRAVLRPVRENIETGSLPSRFLDVRLEDAETGLPPYVKVVGRIGKGERVRGEGGESKVRMSLGGDPIELNYAVLPGFFAGFIAHGPDSPEMTPTLEQVEKLRNVRRPGIGDIADLVEAQLASRSPSGVYTDEMVSEAGYLERHGKAQLLYSVAVRLAEHAGGLRQVQFESMGREVIEPFMEHAVLGGIEGEPQDVLHVAKLHKVVLLYPKGGGKYSAVFYSRGKSGTKTVETEISSEALHEAFPHLFPASGGVRLTPTGAKGVDPNRPIAVVEPMRTETRIPPYGLSFGGYIGAPKQPGEPPEIYEPEKIKRPYFVFNLETESPSGIRTDVPFVYQAVARVLSQRAPKEKTHDGGC